MNVEVSENEDYCEVCQIMPGEVVNEGSYVCRMCDKELKRQARKIESKKRRQEEREDSNTTHKNFKGEKR